MSAIGILLGVVVFVVFDIALITLILRTMAGRTFGDLAEQYPPTEPEPNAVTKRFQSFRFGIINAGFCVHVSVDSSHLHLKPARFLRWFGAKPMSVPWEAIDLGNRRGPYRSAKIGSLNLIGPAWALDLAEPSQT